MLKRVIGRGRVVRKIDLRLRRVRLFDVVEGAPEADRWDVWAGVHMVRGGRSCRRMDDHPLVQAILENRDQYLKLKDACFGIEEAIKKAAEKMQPGDTETMGNITSAAKNMARLSELAMTHLKEMTDGVVDTMKIIGGQSSEEVKLVTTQAKLDQQERLAPVARRTQGKVTGMTSAQIAEQRRLAIERETA